ncbi:MAG: ZIP family metal transporter [Bacteroidetes bacterium]|nr:MAG: ZIP family metal transporter [Bacteroidota bacterium]
MSYLLQIILLVAVVVLGGLLVEWLDGFKQKKITKVLLAFSGGFLLATAFAHFLPELYAEHSSKVGICVLLGFLIQLFLEFFSGGIEHGHYHAGKKIPILLLLSLSVHSFIEGIPLGHSGMLDHHDHGSEHSLLLGIILHRIPVAVALMTLLKAASLGRLNSWTLLIAFSLMAPAGLLLGAYGLSGEDASIVHYLMAVVIGMFLHISTTIIFETSENHQFNLIKLLSILLGVALALLLSPF